MAKDDNPATILAIPIALGLYLTLCPEAFPGLLGEYTV
jgi:hypothetical protein